MCVYWCNLLFFNLLFCFFTLKMPNAFSHLIYSKECNAIYDITFGKGLYYEKIENVDKIFGSLDAKYFLYKEFIDKYTFIYSSDIKTIKDKELGISKILYIDNYADSTFHKILNRFKKYPIKELSDPFYKSGLFICLKNKHIWIIDVNQCPNHTLTNKIVSYLKTDKCFEKSVWIPCGGVKMFDMKK